jgi:hypothetical protein
MLPPTCHAGSLLSAAAADKAGALAPHSKGQITRVSYICNTIWI